MINILICDDDKPFMKKASELVTSLMSSSPYIDLDYKVRSTSDSLSLKNIVLDSPPDILILDIHMPEADGFEIAEVFFENRAKTKIIFLSSYEELVFYSLRFSPFRFVRKDAMEKELPEALYSAIKLIQNDSTNLVVRHYTDIQYVPLSSIKYIEKIKGKNSVSVVCHSESLSHRETIQVLERHLSPLGFVRINSGTLVNLKYVKRISGTELYIGDEVLKVSESNIEKVKHALAQYMRTYGLT